MLYNKKFVFVWVFYWRKYLIVRINKSRLYGYLIDESFKYICIVFGNCCDGNIRLLFFLFDFKLGKKLLVVDFYSFSVRCFCVVVDFIFGCIRMYLCSLWWNLYFYCIVMVMLCWLSIFDLLGYNGWGSGIDWCGYDYFIIVRIGLLK